MTSLVARSPSKMFNAHNPMRSSGDFKKRKREDVPDNNHRKQKASKTSPGQSGNDSIFNQYVPNLLTVIRAAPVVQLETDAHRINQRQKQVDFGKNTLGYQIYTKAIPK
jgi:hypothetical protein